MVIGLALMAAALPTAVATSREQKQPKLQISNRHTQNPKIRRSHLVAHAPTEGQATSAEVNPIQGAKVYVSPDGKVVSYHYLAPKPNVPWLTNVNQFYLTHDPDEMARPFDGGSFPHPSFGKGNTAGLVTVSPEEPPTLRWVFVDSESSALRWGTQTESNSHECGPFNWTDHDEYLMLGGGTLWQAVRMPDGEKWRIYHHSHDTDTPIPDQAESVVVLLGRAV